MRRIASSGSASSAAPVSLEGMIEGLAKMPLEFSPGDVWNYSVSTDVLGYLVGKISGEPFEEFLRSASSQPLGMVDTDFSRPASESRRVSPPATARRRTGACNCRTIRRPAATSTANFVSGGGGLVSTAADYLRFCRMLLNGGALDGVRILSPKTIELMTANHLPGGKDLPDLSVSLFSEATYAGVGFGLGFCGHAEPGAHAHARHGGRLSPGAAWRARTSGSTRAKN